MSLSATMLATFFRQELYIRHGKTVLAVLKRNIRVDVVVLHKDVSSTHHVTHQVEATPGEPAQPPRIISQETIRDPAADCHSSIVDEDHF